MSTFEQVIYTINKDNGLALTLHRWKTQLFINDVERVSFKYQVVIKFNARLHDGKRFSDLIVNDFTAEGLELTPDQLNALVRASLKKAEIRVASLAGLLSDYRYDLHSWGKIERHGVQVSKLN